jgi:choline dehydrogenase-like flavoprotein
MHKGAQCAGIVRDEIHHDPSRGFVGGFQMHTVMFTPETLAKLLLPGAWGRRLTAVLEKYSHLAALLVIGEDLPVPDNGVTLHGTRRDRLGLPVPVVRYHHHPNNEAMLAYALPAAERLYRSLGAKEVFRMTDVFPSTHNLGTARMGEDPRSSVCNAYGRTHDVENLFISDGSLFPTSGCENPTLTIVALALRQADHIAGQMEKGLT